MAEKNESTNTSRVSNIRRHFISECRDSRIVVVANLSPTMHRIYRRQFDRLSRSVYLLRYYSRIARGSSVESSLTKEILTMIDEVNENLDKKIAVADQLLEKNAVKVTKAQFDRVNATIIDPIANRFLQSIKIAQDLEEKLSALWLACVLDDEQRTMANQEIESELRGIQVKCRTLSFGIRDRVQAQQRIPSEQTSDIVISETESGENQENQVELGIELEIPESVEKTPVVKKSKKSLREGDLSGAPGDDIFEEEVAA